MKARKWQYAMAAAVLAVCVSIVGSMAMKSAAPVALKTIEGRVVDKTSNQPIAGAYVLAVYYESGSVPFGHSARWCVKTRGSFTGPDGRFSFPEERKMSTVVTAVFPDFTQENAVSSWQDKKARIPEKILLPDLQLLHRGTSEDHWIYPLVCDRPATHEDVIANIQYLRLLRVEFQKYGPSHLPDALEEDIRSFETRDWTPKKEKQ